MFEDCVKELTALDKGAKLTERERQNKKEKKQRENFRVYSENFRVYRKLFCVSFLLCV